VGTLIKQKGMPMKHIRLLVAAAALICASTAQAYVTQGDTTLDFVGPTPIGANYEMHVGTRPASIMFNYDANHQLRFVATTADAETLMVVAHAGDVITESTLLSSSVWGNTWFSSAYGNHPVTGTDFYVAGMFDEVVVGAGQPTPPGGSSLSFRRFGWTHLVADASGTLTVADSAMAYGELGIIVGTTQAVPEPSSLALMLLGLGFAGLHARRKTMSRN
jgi:hypothetical protein